MPEVIGGAVYELNLDTGTFRTTAAGADATIQKLTQSTQRLDAAAAGSSRSTKAAGDAAQAAGGGFTIMGASLKDVARTGAAVALGMGGLSIAITGTRAILGGTIANASALNESISKSNVVFGASAASIRQWSETSASSMGISQQEAIETAATFGNLFEAMGLSANLVPQYSTSLVQLASDLASFNNADPSDVLLSLRAGLVGEIEPLRKYGVALSETAVQQKAMALGLGDATGQLSESAKIQARYAIILDQTKTAQGDFARTSTGLANSTRSFQASLSNIGADIGQQFITPVTLGTRGATELFESIDKLHVISDVFPTLAEGALVFGAAVTAIKVKSLITDLQQLALVRGGAIGPTPQFTGSFSLGSLLSGINPVTAGIVTLTAAFGALDIASRHFIGTGIIGVFDGEAEAAGRTAAAISRVGDATKDLALLQHEGVSASDATTLALEKVRQSAADTIATYNAAIAGAPAIANRPQLRPDQSERVLIALQNNALTQRNDDLKQIAQNAIDSGASFAQLSQLIQDVPDLKPFLAKHLQDVKDAAGPAGAAVLQYSADILAAKTAEQNFGNALSDATDIAKNLNVGLNTQIATLQLRKTQLEQQKTAMGDAFGSARQAELDAVTGKLDILNAQQDVVTQSLTAAGLELLSAYGPDAQQQIEAVNALLIKLPTDQQIQLEIALPDLAKLKRAFDAFIAALQAGATVTIAIREAAIAQFGAAPRPTAPAGSELGDILQATGGGAVGGISAPSDAAQQFIDKLNAANDAFNQNSTAVAGQTAATKGAGAAASAATNDLLDLAQAFAAWHAQTGGTLADFRVALKLGADKQALDQRLADDQANLNAQTLEMTNSSYQLELTWASLAEQAISSGELIEKATRDLFDGILNNATSTLDAILNGPTREGTQLQLQIDTLQRQADLLKRGGAVDTVPKGQTLTSADRQLIAIEGQIKALKDEQQIRADDLAIMKDQALLADKTLQTDGDLVNADRFLIAVIDNLSGTVHNLDDAMLGLLSGISGGSSVPRLAGGLEYVPRPMLAMLDPGERVLTASENRAYGAQGAARGPVVGPVYVSVNGIDPATFRREWARAGDQAYAAARRAGAMPPGGSGR